MIHWRTYSIIYCSICWINWNQILKLKKDFFLFLTFRLFFTPFPLSKKDVFLSPLFKVYKKSLNFHLHQQKIFWFLVLVFGFSSSNTYDAFTVGRSGKDLENLDCVAPFVLYLCSGAGPAALFWNGSWESEIQNFDSFFLVKSVVMKNVHLMQQTFLKFAFVIRNIVHIAAFKQFFRPNLYF